MWSTAYSHNYTLLYLAVFIHIDLYVLLPLQQYAAFTIDFNEETKVVVCQLHGIHSWLICINGVFNDTVSNSDILYIVTRLRDEWPKGNVSISDRVRRFYCFPEFSDRYCKPSSVLSNRFKSDGGSYMATHLHLVLSRWNSGALTPRPHFSLCRAQGQSCLYLDVSSVKC
jgi:hypothetical protein